MKRALTFLCVICIVPAIAFGQLKQGKITKLESSTKDSIVTLHIYVEVENVSGTKATWDHFMSTEEKALWDDLTLRPKLLTKFYNFVYSSLLLPKVPETQPIIKVETIPVGVDLSSATITSTSDATNTRIAALKKQMADEQAELDKLNQVK